jgi:hypothetical protein
MFKIELTENGKIINSIESRRKKENKEISFWEDLFTIFFPFSDSEEDFGAICKDAEKKIRKIISDWNLKHTEVYRKISD